MKILQVGQEIEVRPGIVAKDQDGKWACKPIRSRILSLLAEQNDLQYAVPGGLIGEFHVLSGYTRKFIHKKIHIKFVVILSI